MRSHSLLLLTAALAVIAPRAPWVMAQSAIILRAPAPSYGCPVGLSAERQSDVQLDRVDTTHRNKSAQSIRVRLIELEDRKILSADIIVHGYPPSQRILPASTSQYEDVSRTFHLVRHEHAEDPLNFNLQVEKVSGIRDVTITSIEYAVGPAWQTSKSASCVAAPNPLVLVGALR